MLGKIPSWREPFPMSNLFSKKTVRPKAEAFGMREHVYKGLGVLDPSLVPLSDMEELASRLRSPSTLLNAPKSRLKFDISLENPNKPENLSQQVTITEPAELKEFWKEKFEEQGQTFEHLDWYRTVVAWRISREMMKCLDVVNPGETLNDGLTYRNDSRDPWTEYVGIRPTVEEPRIRDLILSVLFEQELGVMVPDIDPEYLEPSGIATEEYSAVNDKRLNAWIMAVEVTARRLSIDHGSDRYPDLGRLGLKGVTNPNLTRMLWPSKQDILSFERFVILDACDRIQKPGGIRSTRALLRSTYGLQSEELDAIITSAMREIEDIVVQDSPKQTRALLALQLDDLIARASKALDTRGEIQAIRLKAQVLGIFKVAPEDLKSAFKAAFRDHANKESNRKTLKVRNSEPLLLETTARKS